MLRAQTHSQVQWVFSGAWMQCRSHTIPHTNRQQQSKPVHQASDSWSLNPTKHNWRLKTSPRCRHLANSIKQRCLAFNWCHHLTNWMKHMHVFDSSPFAPLCENMTSSTKPEIHNISHCCKKRTKPGPRVKCTKFDEIWTSGFLDILTDRHTDRQTSTLIAILHNPTRGWVIKTIDLSSFYICADNSVKKC